MSMCNEFVVYLINKYWTKMLLLSWCFFLSGFCLFVLFSSFFFFFWFRCVWSLSSHCSVVIHLPPGWHKCQLPNAVPERSFCGSPWSPQGPGQEKKGKHSTSLSCPWPLHCAPREARDRPGQPFLQRSQCCTLCKLGGLMQ